jgi:hypothetical protein
MDHYEPPGGEPLSRWLSLFIVLAYIIVGGVMVGMLFALEVVLAMLLPLLCIWIPDVVGAYTEALGDARRI